MSGLPDPELFASPGMRAGLASRDISTVYRLLAQAGVTQRAIAQATGQSQSEVCEILQGRQVMVYDVLVRIAAGLGVPRGAMGLGYGAYAEDTACEPGEEVDEDLLRRQFQHLLALAGAAAVGTAVPGVGTLMPGLAAGGVPVDTPTRIGERDVAVISGYTESLRMAARTVGGQAGPATALTGWADSWLDADASPAARRALLSALSDLHVIAAWCCHDSCAPAAAHHHFSAAVRLATHAGDSYRASYALRHAAMMLIDRAEPNNALKLVQLADLHVTTAPHDDPRVPALRSWLAAESALAQAQMSDTDSTARRARSDLARARDGYDPRTPTLAPTWTWSQRWSTSTSAHSTPPNRRPPHPYEPSPTAPTGVREYSLTSPWLDCTCRPVNRTHHGWPPRRSPPWPHCAPASPAPH
jgi:transcriptional regulator with XRE-family HTH domain